ncbi:unnamed protein product [Ectocarpus sp. 12 AP-2014]
MTALLPPLILTLLFIDRAAAFVPSASTKQCGGGGGVRLRSSRSSSSSSSSSSSDKTPSWRLEVDDLVKAASPWGSLVETEIIATHLLKCLPEIARDVSDAARKNELVSGIVLGKGTEARSTVDGLKAVNRQLRQDILPKALEAAPRIASAVPRPGTNTTGSSTTPKRRTGPMEGIAENLYSIKNTARELTPQKLRQGLQTAAAETENIFSRTPSGLYSPSYSLEDAREGFEIRRYASYAVCSAQMDADTARESDQREDDNTGVTDGSGEGFNTLAGYLFGDNKQEVAMDMTTPVNIDVTSTGRTMSFVMPKDVPAEEAPTPRNPRVNVRDVAEGEVLAVREFPGFATDGEVGRQLDTLLWALQLEASTSASPWCAQDPVGKSYRLMQYNPPYTLPWQRTNAIAVQVYKAVPGDSADTENANGNAEREQMSSTISQSVGGS